jgi:hypothetical protein
MPHNNTSTPVSMCHAQRGGRNYFSKNAVSQRLAAACTVQAVHKCFEIRARSTQRYSQVPFPPVPHRLLFPFSCVPFQPSSRPLHAPSASASLAAQRRRLQDRLQDRRQLRRRSSILARNLASSPSITVVLSSPLRPDLFCSGPW